MDTNIHMCPQLYLKHSRNGLQVTQTFHWLYSRAVDVTSDLRVLLIQHNIYGVDPYSQERIWFCLLGKKLIVQTHAQLPHISWVYCDIWSAFITFFLKVHWRIGISVSFSKTPLVLAIISSKQGQSFADFVTLSTNCSKVSLAYHQKTESWQDKRLINSIIPPDLF